jgi:RNA polymerase sigma-70 factor (ECF subfamily)
VHATAPSAAQTEWGAIVLLYDRLLGLAPTYVIEFNRAIAVGMAEGADAGLAAIDRVEGDLGHLRPAARADLLERAGRVAEAAVEYRAAIAAAPTEAEQRALARRLAAVER